MASASVSTASIVSLLPFRTAFDNVDVDRDVNSGDIRSDPMDIRESSDSIIALASLFDRDIDFDVAVGVGVGGDADSGDVWSDPKDMRESSDSARALASLFVDADGTNSTPSLSNRAEFPDADAPIFNATSAYNTESTTRCSARVSDPPPV